MNNYYFEKEDSEECYPIAHFINKMERAGLSEIKIFEAVSVRDNSFIWCKRFWDAVERGSCGKSCSDYQPAMESQAYASIMADCMRQE